MFSVGEAVVSVSNSISERPETKNNYECDYCGRTYARKWSLVMHITGVHDNGRYPCMFCPNKFDTYFLRSSHVQKFHYVKLQERIDMDENRKKKKFSQRGKGPGNINFVCCAEEGCERIFTRFENFFIHYDTFHKGMKFVCPVCTKPFLSNKAFSYHIERYHDMDAPVGWHGQLK